MPSRPIPVLELLLALALTGGCGKEHSGDTLTVGLLLSYTGELAANSMNSERAFIMALEAANAAGGIEGRSLVMVARDSQSNARLVTPPAKALVDQGPVLIIGPDTPELAVEVRPMLADRTLIMPSIATSDADIYKPHSWFVMGPSPREMACVLLSQALADGHDKPVAVIDPHGYNNLVGRQLGYSYGLSQIFLPSEVGSDESTVQPIKVSGSRGFILAASPSTATSLFYALAGMGALDPNQWYLAPTLHTTALLENLPKSLIVGARGVAAGLYQGAAAFRERFQARWGDLPFDDAYAFYDAGAVAALALERALVMGADLGGTGLSAHIMAVTRTGAATVQWDEIGRGLQLLRDGQEVSYSGVTGPLAFDSSGQARSANPTVWSIGEAGFSDPMVFTGCKQGAGTTTP